MNSDSARKVSKFSRRFEIKPFELTIGDHPVTLLTRNNKKYIREAKAILSIVNRDSSVFYDIDLQDDDGDTALTNLMRLSLPEDEKLEIVQLILAKGADVNIKNKKGFNAFYYAFTKGHGKIAAFLLQNGADMNDSGIPSKELETYYEWKKSRRNAKMLKNKGGRRKTMKKFRGKNKNI